MQNQSNRRKYQRVPVSFLINCLRADLSRIGGKAYNLSEGGIAIKTNCPISNGEQLTVEFVEPESGNIHKVKGEVVWSNFTVIPLLKLELCSLQESSFLFLSGLFKPLLGNLFDTHLADNLDKVI